MDNTLIDLPPTDFEIPNLRDDAARANLIQLLEGNRRFAAGVPHYPNQNIARRVEGLMLQRPVAAVLSCSDSRVPVELVLDQGIGDLFVARTAGCAVHQIALGGLEYAVGVLNCPLILIMGHTKCGAVSAAMRSDPLSANLEALLNLLRPAIRAMPPAQEDEDRWLTSVYATVRAQRDEMLLRSELLAQRHADGELEIVGAVYHLETGLVDLVG